MNNFWEWFGTRFLPSLLFWGILWAVVKYYVINKLIEWWD